MSRTGKNDGEAFPHSASNNIKSAKIGEEQPPKCKNCTLEEVSVSVNVIGNL
jgi:hypothetical protein